MLIILGASNIWLFYRMRRAEERIRKLIRLIVGKSVP